MAAPNGVLGYYARGGNIQGCISSSIDNWYRIYDFSAWLTLFLLPKNNALWIRFSTIICNYVEMKNLPLKIYVIRLNFCLFDVKIEYFTEHSTKKEKIHPTIFINRIFLIQLTFTGCPPNYILTTFLILKWNSCRVPCYRAAVSYTLPRLRAS